MLQNNLKKVILDTSCILCSSKKLSEKINFICDDCLSAFNLSEISSCNVCFHPLDSSGKCPSCSKIEKIYYDSYSFIQYYDDFFRKILVKWKKEEYFMINRLFFELLLLKKMITIDYQITVVPDTIFKRFKKGRSSLGYLLSLLKKRGFDTISDVYRRRFRLGSAQKTGNQKQRIDGISNLYELPTKNIGKYSGKVILIDDIYTTGATLNYGAKLLKEAGFDEVKVVSFFRAKLA